MKKIMWCCCGGSDWRIHTIATIGTGASNLVSASFVTSPMILSCSWRSMVKSTASWWRCLSYVKPFQLYGRPSRNTLSHDILIWIDLEAYSLTFVGQMVTTTCAIFGLISRLHHLISGEIPAIETSLTTWIGQANSFMSDGGMHLVRIETPYACTVLGWKNVKDRMLK